jgi:ABC-type transport system substrate-binding protein
MKKKNELEPWLAERMTEREDGRLEMKLKDMPKFPEGQDKLPNPIEIDGQSKTWVGIGWVDNGPATGKEPLVINTEDDDGG